MSKIMIYSPLSRGAMLHHLISICQKIPFDFIYCSDLEGQPNKLPENTVFFSKGSGMNKLLWSLNPLFSYRFVRLAKKQQIDVIFVINGEFIPNNVWIFLMCRLARLKVHMIWHDVTPHRGKVSNYLYWLLSIVNALIANKIVTHNKRYLKYLRGVLPFKTVEHLPFPVYDFLLDNNQESVPENNLYLFIGRLEEYKGIDRFIQLARSNPDSNFRIVGTGSSKIVEMVEGVSLPNLSCKLEFVSDSDMIDELRACRGLVLPYYHGSQSSLPFLAALLNKQLICSTNVNFDSDVLELDGVLVDFGARKNFTLAFGELKKSFINLAAYDQSFVEAAKEILQ